MPRRSTRLMLCNGRYSIAGALLPLPSSFLVDAEGRLAVLYKGPVSAEQLLEDLKLLHASDDQLLRSSTPFQSRWISRPAQISPMAVASQLVDAARVDDAIEYLNEYTKRLSADTAQGRTHVEDVRAESDRAFAASAGPREASYQLSKHWSASRGRLRTTVTAKSVPDQPLSPGV